MLLKGAEPFQEWKTKLPTQSDKFHFFFYRELDNVLDLLKKSADNSLSSPDSSLRPNSVINLDDSYGLPSPSERNVVVKVRTRSGIKRFTMKAVSSMVALSLCDKLHKLGRQLCFVVDFKIVLLTLNLLV